MARRPPEDGRNSNLRSLVYEDERNSECLLHWVTGARESRGNREKFSQFWRGSGLGPPKDKRNSYRAWSTRRWTEFEFARHSAPKMDVTRNWLLHWVIGAPESRSDLVNTPQCLRGSRWLLHWLVGVEEAIVYRFRSGCGTRVSFYIG